MVLWEFGDCIDVKFCPNEVQLANFICGVASNDARAMSNRAHFTTAKLEDYLRSGCGRNVRKRGHTVADEVDAPYICRGLIKDVQRRIWV